MTGLEVGWDSRHDQPYRFQRNARLTALYDALDEWFIDRRFQSCMFIKTSSEYQETGHPIHAQ